MEDFLDYAPIAAAAFAIPQFLPQLVKLQRTDDTAGVSWSWATLTSVNNATWFAYFALASYWTALVPASSATLLAGTLAIMLTRRGQAKMRPAVLISSWVALLVAGFTVAGRAGLGTLLTVAFVLQVTPSLWTAYRTAQLTGVARGTWLLSDQRQKNPGLHEVSSRRQVIWQQGANSSLASSTRHQDPLTDRSADHRPRGRLMNAVSGARHGGW
jgi:uncharacterized protein with PQ loop repeat